MFVSRHGVAKSCIPRAEGWDRRYGIRAGYRGRAAGIAQGRGELRVLVKVGGHAFKSGFGLRKIRVDEPAEALHFAAVEDYLVVQHPQPVPDALEFFFRLGEHPGGFFQCFFLIDTRAPVGIARNDAAVHLALGAGQEFLTFAEFSGPVRQAVVLQPHMGAREFGFGLDQCRGGFGAILRDRQTKLSEHRDRRDVRTGRHRSSLSVVAAWATPCRIGPARR